MYRRHERKAEECREKNVEERATKFERSPKNNCAKCERGGRKYYPHSITGKRACQLGPQCLSKKRRIERQHRAVPDGVHDFLSPKECRVKRKCSGGFSQEQVEKTGRNEGRTFDDKQQ